MGKFTISMVIFNSYFDITRGYVFLCKTTHQTNTYSCYFQWSSSELEAPLSEAEEKTQPLGRKSTRNIKEHRLFTCQLSSDQYPCQKSILLVGSKRDSPFLNWNPEYTSLPASLILKWGLQIYWL